MTRAKIKNNRKDMHSEPKTERRHNGQSETQRFASMENFALFTLRGIQTHITCSRIESLLSPDAVIAICKICEDEINKIKTAQELRKENKK